MGFASRFVCLDIGFVGFVWLLATGANEIELIGRTEAAREASFSYTFGSLASEIEGLEDFDRGYAACSEFSVPRVLRASVEVVSKDLDGLSDAATGSKTSIWFFARFSLTCSTA